MKKENTSQFPHDDVDDTPQSEPDDAPSKMPQSRIETADNPPQAYEQLIAHSQHFVRTSKHFASFRERLNAEITSIRDIKKFPTKIGHAQMFGLIYDESDESVEFAARSYLLFLTRYAALFFARAQRGSEFAKRLCAVVTLNIDALELEVMDYYGPEGPACALVEIFRLEIQRIQSDVQEAEKELTQALYSFAKSPGTKAREFIAITFLRALRDAESDAQEACRRYEHAEVISRIVEANAVYGPRLSLLCELDFYNPRDFASRYGIKPPAVRQHFRNFSENGKFDRAIEETLSAGAGWMILDRKTIKRFDSYLRSETRDDKIQF